MFQPGPIATRGQRIGLLGGSFDPPHEGHVHITRWALKTLGLEAVWWLVSPGNPLKPEGPAPLHRRVAASRELIRHPRVHVTDVEAHMGTRYTADTLGQLSIRYPGVRFTWLMGSDNLASFHRWERWDWIMEHFPVAVLARPGRQVLASLSPAGRRFARWRLPQHAAALVTRGEAPRWTLLVGPMSPVSSTAIRERGDWP